MKNTMTKWPKSRVILVTLLVLVVVVGSLTVWFVPRDAPEGSDQFSGPSAFQYAEAQMSFGPRPTGSEANKRTGDYILNELKRSGWLAETQEFTYRDTLVRNIVGKKATGQGPIVILGAHYDTRMHADRDPVNPDAPAPGANDGASGVAVLLELARSLTINRIHNEIWLVFFDAEDNGGIKEWDWVVGSTYMAEHLTVIPQAMILVDMVGDKDQQIYIDKNSDRSLSTELFEIAVNMGYGGRFIPEPKYAMIDDHIPFARRGIPAVDLIDFDYPYWHTTADTIDKISPDSLEAVGRTLESFAENLSEQLSRTSTIIVSSPEVYNHAPEDLAPVFSCRLDIESRM